MTQTLKANPTSPTWYCQDYFWGQPEDPAADPSCKLGSLIFAALLVVGCGNDPPRLGSAAGAPGTGGGTTSGAGAGNGGQAGSHDGTAGASGGAASSGEAGAAGSTAAGADSATVDPCAGEEGAKRFAVADFGAIGDGVTDDMPAFERTLAAVRQHVGASIVELGKARSYRLVSAAHPQWQTFEFALDLPSHTVVVGQGSTLLLGPNARALWLEGVDAVAVCQLDIDYVPLPFTQGAVTAVDVPTASFEVSIAADFDVPPDVTDPPASPPFFGKILHKDGSFPHLFVRKLQRLAAGGRVVRVFPSDAALVSGIGIGETVVLPVAGVGHRDPETLHVFHSGNVSLEDVRVFSAPLFTSSLRENHGPLSFRRVEVRPKPGSARLISSWRDAFHVKDNRAALLFDTCYVDHSQDDAFNVSSMWLRIAGVASKDVTIQSPYGGLLPEVGDMVQIYDAQTGRVVGQTMVAGRDVAKRSLSLADALNGVAAGQQLISLDACNPGTIIRNSTVIGTGMRLRSPLTFEGNTVSGGEVLISSENDVEGPVPRAIVLRANTFDGPFLALSIELQILQAGPAERSISGIRLENNVFKQLLQIHDADGIDFTGNDFQTDSSGNWLNVANDRNIVTHRRATCAGVLTRSRGYAVSPSSIV